ncbi:MAG TPA: hypothetical protein PKK12_12370, partial [Candidatus Aminicenantes bacterium]|nr:hypothetical protein [Candidatus Aminicenantes bacterium]
RFFNLKTEIPTALIRRELRQRDGWRVFHPYYGVFTRLVDAELGATLCHDAGRWVRRTVKSLMGRV